MSKMKGSMFEEDFLEQQMIGNVLLVDQIAEVEREIRMRRSAYPKWVAKGRMSAQAAQDGIRKMLAVKATLERLWRATAGGTQGAKTPQE